MDTSYTSSRTAVMGTGTSCTDGTGSSNRRSVTIMIPGGATRTTFASKLNLSSSSSSSSADKESKGKRRRKRKIPLQNDIEKNGTTSTNNDENVKKDLVDDKDNHNDSAGGTVSASTTASTTASDDNKNESINIKSSSSKSVTMKVMDVRDIVAGNTEISQISDNLMNNNYENEEEYDDGDNVEDEYDDEYDDDDDYEYYYEDENGNEIILPSSTSTSTSTSTSQGTSLSSSLANNNGKNGKIIYVIPRDEEEMALFRNLMFEPVPSDSPLMRQQQHQQQQDDGTKNSDGHSKDALSFTKLVCRL